MRPIPSGHISLHSPLWFNPQLSEFGSIPNPGVWACKGIKYINQICFEGRLQTFNRLKQQHKLPNSHLFRFLQLRHAFNTQFENAQVAFYTLNLETLLRDEALSNPLSTIYKALLHNVHTGLENLKAKWVVDFPTL